MCLCIGKWLKESASSQLAEHAIASGWKDMYDVISKLHLEGPNPTSCSIVVFRFLTVTSDCIYFPIMINASRRFLRRAERKPYIAFDCIYESNRIIAQDALSMFRYNFIFREASLPLKTCEVMKRTRCRWLGRMVRFMQVNDAGRF